jgi:hypothetical protein
MNSNVRFVAILARSADQSTLTETLHRPIVAAAQYQWNVFGHWVGFHSRVTVGVINDRVSYGCARVRQINLGESQFNRFRACLLLRRNPGQS